MIDVVAPARRLLDHTIAHFEGRGWDLPERRYLAAGAQHSIAVDDEHLMVSLIQINPGPSDAGGTAGGAPSTGIAAFIPPRASLMLRLMRCVPTVDGKGRAPAVEKLHEAGARLLADPGRLLDAVASWLAAEPMQKNATWGQVDPQGPEGGYAGHIVTVTLSTIQ